MDQNTIVEITTIEQLLEMSAMGAGAVQGAPVVKKDKEMTEDEKILREHIRRKLKNTLNEQIKQEYELRMIIRNLLNEGDLSDTHPHRSTGINTLEDVLKKSIPTLRTDYKKLTTDENQRKSFRSHIVKAIIDALKPETVNSQYLQGAGGGSSALLSEPTGGGESDDLDVEDVDLELDDDDEKDDDLKALEEAEIEVDIDDEDDNDKKIPVEKDDEPSPEEEFGGGLEGMDETGRNHAYTTYRKISQYVLDAYDSLANPEDKKIFLDYLVTNIKLYFDKFEDELQKTVDEPTTPEYDQAKQKA
jgi:hypothetical protein